ncbi:ABC transporter permease (plasmid) [Rhodococcus globerulus]|uniref:ABC transporter permease n=1 Tax=Rhodococcus globerulus TaxID=33008 RepID=UPI0039EC3F17
MIRSRAWFRYLLLRSAQAVAVVWAAFTFSFVLLWALPSDPLEVIMGQDAGVNIDAVKLEELRHEFGLDRPLLAQYLDGLWQALHGNLGNSIQTGQSVAGMLSDALPQTALLGLASTVLAVIGGTVVAVTAVYPRSRLVRQAILSLPSLGVSMPTFLIGMLLIQIGAFQLKLFPPIGNDGWRSLVLPAITLAVPTGAIIAQLLAKSLRTTMLDPYITTAAAKGASKLQIYFSHALRNAAIPTFTMFGMIVGGIFGGAVVTETVFARNGIGRVLAEGVTFQDIPVVNGAVVIAAAAFVLCNLIVDLIVGVLDPRIPTRSHGTARVKLWCRRLFDRPSPDDHAGITA